MDTFGRRDRRIAFACLAGLSVGVILIVAGGLWQLFAGPRLVWSPEQVREHRAARMAWHDLQYDEGAPDAAADTGRQAQIDAARARFERIQADLDSAIALHEGRGTRLIYVGLAAIVLFGVGYLSSRPR